MAEEFEALTDGSRVGVAIGSVCDPGLRRRTDFRQLVNALRIKGYWSKNPAKRHFISKEKICRLKQKLVLGSASGC